MPPLTLILLLPRPLRPWLLPRLPVLWPTPCLTPTPLRIQPPQHPPPASCRERPLPLWARRKGRRPSRTTLKYRLPMTPLLWPLSPFIPLTLARLMTHRSA